MSYPKHLNPSIPGYDRAIIPGEVAAREEGEGQSFGHTPHKVNHHSAEIRTTDGYTVDQEGLLNNYAIESEMYYHTSGDMRQHEHNLQVERAHELEDLQEDEADKLTAEHDWRYKGPGLI